MITQCERIIKYLKTGKQLTQHQAINDFGIMRLASRINDLRQQGFNITTDMIDVQNRWGEQCKVAAYKLHHVKQPHQQSL